MSAFADRGPGIGGTTTSQPPRDLLAINLREALLT